MKKLFCILCCLILISVMCSCRKGGNYGADSIDSTDDFFDLAENSEIISSISSNEEVTSKNESEKVKSEKTESVLQSAVESEKTSSKEKKSEKTSSEKTSKAESSEVQSVVVPVESQTPQINTTITSKFTVNDPDNLRGLDVKSIGFSYGVASGGVPHNQSVINQNTFDGFQGVNALALDNKTDEKVMYLTFDNGYEYENLTASILDTLKEKGVKAAFFITMGYAKENPTLVRRMIDEGHIVGNHSTTHPTFPNLTRTQMADEIAQLDDYLINNFSYTSPYFRFPTGAYSECSLELVTSIGFKSVFWSVAYADWDTKAQKGAEYAHSTVTSRFHSGAVILLHAVSRDNAQALGRIIDTAVSQGYSFKTLDDYFNR